MFDIRVVSGTCAAYVFRWQAVTAGDGIDSRTFNLEMTYICICECIKKDPYKYILYVWATRKFAAFLRHAA